MRKKQTPTEVLSSSKRKIIYNGKCGTVTK